MRTKICVGSYLLTMTMLQASLGVTVRDSDPMMLDLQSGVRVPVEIETVTYGLGWTGGGPVDILLDGTILETELIGEGSFDWIPSEPGFHTLAMGDALGRTNTVTFLVPATIADSDGAVLDLQSGVRRAEESETVAFGPDWTGGGPVTVSVNGETIAADCLEEGSLVWKPAGAGLYELALADALGRSKKVLFAVGESEASGDGALDILPGVRVAEREQPLSFSTAWLGAPNATVSVLEDGSPILQGMSGEGTTEWLPTESGLYGLVHETQTGGATSESLSALFLVLADTFGPWMTYTNGEIIVTETGKATLSTTVPGGEIRYTLDGSDPAVSGLAYEKPLRITDACTIKAQVFVDGVAYGYVSEASVAFGQTADPTITSEGGVTFHFSDNHVILSCATEGAAIHYTLDGTDPNANSAVYGEPITISSDTTVRAYASRTNYFDSAVVSLDLFREWLKLSPPTFTPTSFSGGSVLVAISNDTEGATIRFARDGADLTSAGTVYTAPIHVIGETEFIAQATQYDYLDSDVVTQTIVRIWQPGDAIGTPGWTISQDASHPWVLDQETTHDGLSAMRSGAISDNEISAMTTTVSGAGTLAFWWKADCEGDDADAWDDWDRLELLVDGKRLASLDSRTDWVPVSVSLDEGEHTIVWQYVKDSANSLYGDCGWVDDVVWVPTESEWTTTTPEPVPYAWLRQYGLLPDGTDPEAVAWMPNGKADADGKPQQVWSEYVTGTDPTVKSSRFLTFIEMDADGNPIITYLPNLGKLRSYRILGKENLTDESWTSPTNATHRFFRVKVSVPK